jgi:hypothetical protein
VVILASAKDGNGSLTGKSLFSEPAALSRNPAADSMLDGRLPFPVSRNFVMTSFGQVGKQSGAFALVIGIPAIRITSISG